MGIPINRRQWLRRAGAAATATALSYAAVKPLAYRAFLPDGQPAPEELLKTFLVIKTDSQPYHLAPKPGTNGTGSIDMPAGQFEISMVLPVRDFGRVYLYSDNAGAHYPAAGRKDLLLNYEFARSRAAFVRRYMKAATAEGVTFRPDITERLTRGEAALERASVASDLKAKAGHSNDSLTDTMWAGEMAALERARYHIGKRGTRTGFLFGCNSFGYGRSEEYARLYREIFNFATVPFYRAGTEKVEGQPDFRMLDGILERIASQPILLKGHPLVWFHSASVPEFLKTKKWPEIRESTRHYVLRCVSKYRSRIHSWDVINEAHDWANELDFDQSQFMDLTRMAAEMTREADPTAFRVVNACSTWGEYVSDGRNYKGVMRQPVRTPLEYFKAVQAAGINFEAVGLQLYNPNRDMLEIERHLETFFALKKPVHITELGVPSSSANAKKGALQKLWHGMEWTPAAQADWVEQFYTICYSKPQIEAISWWDMKDPGFIRDAGLVTEQMEPKESYRRLQSLIASWRA